MSLETELAQSEFLARGGVLQLALRSKMKSGEIQQSYTFHEYPKALRIPTGHRDVEHVTEDVKGRTLITVKKDVPQYDEYIVHSAEEEERVLAGRQTDAQMEDERQELIRRCKHEGIKVDVSWSAVRLRRELGEKLDEPEPADEMAALQEKLARLQEMADMKAKIEALEAQLAKPADDLDAMRAELTALGVRVDGRWSAVRLREELDRATSPDR